MNHCDKWERRVIEIGSQMMDKWFAIEKINICKKTNCWTRYQISRRCHMWFIFSIWFQNDFGKLEQHIRTRYFPQKVFSLTREFTGVFPGFCLRLVRGPTSLKIQLVLQQKALVWMVLTSGYATCWYKHIYIYTYIIHIHIIHETSKKCQILHIFLPSRLFHMAFLFWPAKCSWLFIMYFKVAKHTSLDAIE